MVMHRSEESAEDKKVARRNMRQHQREVELTDPKQYVGIEAILIDLRLSKIQFGLSAGFPNVSFSIWVPCDDMFEADKEKTLTKAVYRMAQLACENYPKSTFFAKWYDEVSDYFEPKEKGK